MKLLFKKVEETVKVGDTYPSTNPTKQNSASPNKQGKGTVTML